LPQHLGSRRQRLVVPPPAEPPPAELVGAIPLEEQAELVEQQYRVVEAPNGGLYVEEEPDAEVEFLSLLALLVVALVYLAVVSFAQDSLW